MTLTARLIQRALTPTQIYGSGLDDYFAGNTPAGVQVTIDSVMRAASGACIRLLSDDISTLPLDFFRKMPTGDSEPIPAPDWYLYPTTRRWDTWPHHISQVLVSLLTDGNAFVEGLPNMVDPQHMTVLDPARVSIRHENGRSTYVVSSSANALINAIGGAEYSDAEVMHIPWVTLPGKIRGLSILEATKDSTGLELAAREWASRFFSNGATLGGIIEIPREAGAISKESAEALRDQFTNRHQGKRKAFALGVLTGGARWVQNTVTPEDASLAPLWRHVIEEAARLYHVPPHLLASQETGGQAYASVEHRSIEYVQHAIVPIVTRLEAAYSRLIPGEDTYVRFNVSALLRGDTKTRAEAYSILLQNRILRPEEARALEDLRPDPNLKGYLQTPNNTGPDPRIIDLGNLIEAGFAPDAALAYLGLPPIAHAGALVTPGQAPGQPPVNTQTGSRSMNAEEDRAAISVPSYVRSNAARGLRYYEDGQGGDGLVAATISDARDMASGTVTEAKLRKMGPWISRHLVDLQAPRNRDANHPDYPGPGLVAMLLWGAGPDEQGARRTLSWVERKVAFIDAKSGS